MSYKPNPIDTSKIVLTADIKQLTEQLAKNTHDLWAQKRFSEGWIYGPKRNDEKKEHPCLIAYEDLPESEKEYDRVTALETLKLIVALGYKLEKK